MICLIGSLSLQILDNTPYMTACREACRDSQTSTGLLAVELERLTPDLEDMSSKNPLCGKNSVH
jgi:hypothetical protein